MSTCHKQGSISAGQDVLYSIQRIGTYVSTRSSPSTGVQQPNEKGVLSMMVRMFNNGGEKESDELAGSARTTTGDPLDLG